MADRADQPEFQRRQYEFAAHIRNPAANQRPHDVEDRRMAIYRDLFYNNVEGFLATGFPVLRKIMSDEAWHRMARDFFAGHRAHSPYFLDIPKEFLHYLDHTREPQADDPAFLRELAHYEWVELALSTHEDPQPPAELHRDGDLLGGHPLVSQLAWPLSYHFPVHRIGPNFRPDQPNETPTHLLVYRDCDDAVGFLELNAVSARLFGILAEDPAISGQAALDRIAQELQHPNPDVVVQGGLAILQDWRNKGILLGVTYPSA